MKIVLFATMLLAGLYGVAGAQEASPSPTPVPTETVAPAAPAAPAKVYYLEVDPNDLAAISQALMELPKKIADPLVLKLNAQLQAQDRIVAAKTKAAEEPKKGKK